MIASYFFRAAVSAALVLTVVQISAAQRKGKPVTASASSRIKVIDIAGLRQAIKPNGKPLLINFWATWCDPCVEEFPEIVKIDEAYRGKIDVITISLDYLSELNGDVPKFLTQMNATMPAYLLHTPDENAAIALIANDWNGGLPMSVLYKPDGSKAYLRMGKIKPQAVRAEIDKLLSAAAPSSSQ